MLFRFLFLIGLLGAVAAAEDTVLFQTDFQKDEVERPAPEFQTIAGGFKVAAEGEQKFLELPGAPLDSYSVLFGTAGIDGSAVTAKCFGTKTGRKFPTFAVGLGGGGGYRLQVSPAKKALEIIRGDLVKASAPFEWKSGAWTTVKFQIRKDGDKWRLEGKAWPSGDAEPANWTIRFEEPTAPPNGKASLWGSPYSGTPIRFDDLAVSPIGK